VIALNESRAKSMVATIDAAILSLQAVRADLANLKSFEEKTPQPLAATDPSALLTVAELSARIGVPQATIYAWRTAGKGPRGLRIGRYVRYRMQDVEAWEQTLLNAEDQ
jgi:predicted DNA-binding transcriptional regulator AlpA